MEKNVTKNERKRRRKLSAKLAAMLGLPIAATSCGPVDTVSNVGTNYNEEPKKPVIEQETTEKTTVDMTIEEILTTRKSSTINNTVTTANNSYNNNGYTNNDYYYDDTVYLDPEDVPTYQEPGIPQYQPQTQGNTQGNAQKPTQGNTSSSTALSSKSSSKPTSTSVAPSSSNKQSTSGRKTSTTSTSTTTTTKKTTTTTTTTTTKKPETTTTQAPVIEEPEYREYTLEDIKTNHGAFELYAQYLTNDLMAGNAMSMSYTNYTAGGRETVLFLAMLNEGYISDDVLGDVFADFSEEELKNYTEFIYSIADMQEKFGTDVDFSKYTLNPEIGTYINDIDDAYRNGEIEDFLYNAYMNGNMVEGGWGNPAIESMLCSYDTNNIYGTGQDLNIVFMDSYMENLYKKIETTKGISYTR